MDNYEIQYSILNIHTEYDESRIFFFTLCLLLAVISCHAFLLQFEFNSLVKDIAIFRYNQWKKLEIAVRSAHRLSSAEKKSTDENKFGDATFLISSQL